MFGLEVGGKNFEKAKTREICVGVLAVVIVWFFSHCLLLFSPNQVIARDHLVKGEDIASVKEICVPQLKGVQQTVNCSF